MSARQIMSRFPRPLRFPEMRRLPSGLASDDAGYITGQTLHVDGGMVMV